MKQLLFLTSVLLSVLSMNAQEDFDYRPFIEEGKVWVSAIYLGYRPWSGLNILYDYFEKDTIVADTPWFVLF